MPAKAQGGDGGWGRVMYYKKKLRAHAKKVAIYMIESKECTCTSAESVITRSLGTAHSNWLRKTNRKNHSII